MSLLITHKFYSDFFYSNKYIAQISGILSLEELNKLEELFLEVIDFEINVD